MKHGNLILTKFLVSTIFQPIYRKPKSFSRFNSSSYYESLLNARHSFGKLKIFLCGKELTNDQLFQDKRYRLKKFLFDNMGCDPFMGEDIPGLTEVTFDEHHDYLTMEVREAVASDLIFLFVESLGTASELTAFITDKAILPKVYAFNDIAYEGAKSFLNGGPLRYLQRHNPDQLIYYSVDEMQDGLSESLVHKLDKIISKEWFRKCQEFGFISKGWFYNKFVVFCAIHVLYPVTDDELAEFFLNHIELNALQKILYELRIEKHISKMAKTFYQGLSIILCH